MPARGTSVYWNKKRLNALKRLAGKGSNNGAKIDWVSASINLPKDRELLKHKTDHQLSKAFSRYKHVLEGNCYRCGKKRDDLEVLTCKKCRKEATKYHMQSKRYFVRKEECQKNNKSIKKYLKIKTKAELVEFITQNINSFTVDQKIELLDDFINEHARR